MCAAIILIIIAIIVILILRSLGVFNKPANCEHCGKELKGTEQVYVGPGAFRFILCGNCYSKINIAIEYYAKRNWRYSDYVDYLNWEEETHEERDKFNSSYSYPIKKSKHSRIDVDIENGLFRYNAVDDIGIVFRFSDIAEGNIDFEPSEIKDGIINTKVKGDEYIEFTMNRPCFSNHAILRKDVACVAKPEKLFSSKYNYYMADEFVDFIRTFSICFHMAHQQMEQNTEDITEIEKALALFMFDSMDEVTEDNLRKQRNILIKAFHPDNNESNESYSQKINAAYELLQNIIRG